MNKISQASSYFDLRKALAEFDCRLCGLSAERHHLVIDRGNPDAGVVLIGEAPGAHEDMQGKPFVGKAGKILDQMLAEVGFDTNRDGLIINVAKCRPPGNRPPGREEAAACLPFLRKQLELARPKMVLLLGATAYRHVLGIKGTFSITKEAGKFFQCAEFPGIEWMVLFHPSYLARDPRKKPIMQEHLRAFAARWREIFSPAAKR